MMILLIKSLQELNADVRTYLDPHCLLLLLEDVDHLQQDLFRLLIELLVRKRVLSFGVVCSPSVMNWSV